MQMFTESKGYANDANAIKALQDALYQIGETLDSVRWLLTRNADGRVVPVVVVTGHPKMQDLLLLVHFSKVCVLG